MPTPPLSTNGLPMPDDFEFASYEAIHSRIGPLHDSYRTSWPEYASAWVTLSHRFYACTEYDESFTESVQTHGGAPAPIERHRQERDLYGFLFLAYQLSKVSAMDYLPLPRCWIRTTSRSQPQHTKN